MPHCFYPLAEQRKQLARKTSRTDIFSDAKSQASTPGLRIFRFAGKEVNQVADNDDAA